jgi:hypothetical protein
LPRVSRSRSRAETLRDVAGVIPASSAAASTASPNAAAVGNLSSGSNESARIHTAERGSGTEATTSRGVVLMPPRIRSTSAASLSPRIKRCPASISHSTMPAE